MAPSAPWFPHPQQPIPLHHHQPTPVCWWKSSMLQCWLRKPRTVGMPLLPLQHVCHGFAARTTARLPTLQLECKTRRTMRCPSLSGGIGDALHPKYASCFARMPCCCCGAAVKNHTNIYIFTSAVSWLYSHQQSIPHLISRPHCCSFLAQVACYSSLIQISSCKSTYHVVGTPDA